MKAVWTAAKVFTEWIQRRRVSWGSGGPVATAIELGEATPGIFLPKVAEACGLMLPKGWL